jgi:beta-lactamase superfamily II metal-dependent hydrolase
MSHVRRSLYAALIAAVAVSLLSAQARRTLDIYVVDVEGGNATLFVSPSGESLLIDTGNGGAGAVRDAERILAAAKDAALTQIDHLITTHYHGDHYGAMTEVAARVPIRHFIDHGPNVQPNPNVDGFLQKEYATLHGGARHTVVKPGDRIAIAGLETRIVTSAGQVLQTALPGGGGANPYCAASKPQAPDASENAQSVGVHLTFGRFRTVMLGDLTWNKELDLMCPANRLGPVDLYLVSHHGQPSSNS